MKVRNLKANHNSTTNQTIDNFAVLASVKVRNLKANHNLNHRSTLRIGAVLASVKVRNLKANHNPAEGVATTGASCISKCEGTESES